MSLHFSNALQLILGLALANMHDRVTVDIEGNDGEFLFGGKHGFGIFNRSTVQYRYIKKAWSEEEIADGKDKM